MEPGYRRILFRPQPGGGLTWASAAHETPYGRAAISWRTTAAGFSVEVEVPTGTTARVELPGQEPVEIGSGRFDYTVAAVS
jgi:alpha-L-rhamnosidase